MVNKRLFHMGDKKQIYAIVLYQWISMVLNIALIVALAYQLEAVYHGTSDTQLLLKTIAVFGVVFSIRYVLKKKIAEKGHLASANMRNQLRKLIYRKLLALGSSYTKVLSTAEVMQVSTEGVEQLEMYYGKYLPQFFYCMVAPPTLFLFVAQIDLKSALALFICVPLIPVSIVFVQKIAKKLLAKYWGIYTQLGDSFLENLQGLTTLKIYKADEVYHKEMNDNAEHFRIITMKVLSMQLNSIIVMDTVAYGGAALGGVLAITALQNGSITMMGAIIIILLASEFFLPMRAMGSFFHIAMNGMAAAGKMFQILDMEEETDGEAMVPEKVSAIAVRDLAFQYTKEQTTLRNISMVCPIGMTAIVGKSGCGKSTLLEVLRGAEREYAGEITISSRNNAVDLSYINRKELAKKITFVNAHGYVFQGSVAENLKMVDENLSEEEMISSLKKVNLWGFLETQNGLDTKLLERGSNFSGGQKQRLCLARALLRESEIYIFDEVTSNIDPDSEDDIMDLIYNLAKTKVVVLISHRLSNVVGANQIVVIDNQTIAEKGTHQELMLKNGYYKKLFTEQEELENYRTDALDDYREEVCV